MSCLPNWNSYKVQSWYTDGARRRKTHKRHDLQRLKDKIARSRGPYDRVLAHKLRTKSLRNTKIGRKVAHPMGNNAHQVRGQKVKGEGHSAD